MLALYVGKRLLMAVIVCLVVIWLLIVVVKLVPGDPASIFGSARGIRPSPQEIRFVDNALGLNKPITVQYWDFLKGAVHGDLGVDLQVISSQSRRRSVRTCRIRSCLHSQVCSCRWWSACRWVWPSPDTRTVSSIGRSAACRSSS